MSEHAYEGLLEKKYLPFGLIVYAKSMNIAFGFQEALKIASYFEDGLGLDVTENMLKNLDGDMAYSKVQMQRVVEGLNKNVESVCSQPTLYHLILVKNGVTLSMVEELLIPAGFTYEMLNGISYEQFSNKLGGLRTTKAYSKITESYKKVIAVINRQGSKGQGIENQWVDKSYKQVVLNQFKSIYWDLPFCFTPESLSKILRTNLDISREALIVFEREGLVVDDNKNGMIYSKRFMDIFDLIANCPPHYKNYLVDAILETEKQNGPLRKAVGNDSLFPNIPYFIIENYREFVRISSKCYIPKNIFKILFSLPEWMYQYFYKHMNENIKDEDILYGLLNDNQKIMFWLWKKEKVEQEIDSQASTSPPRHFDNSIENLTLLKKEAEKIEETQNVDALNEKDSKEILQGFEELSDYVIQKIVDIREIPIGRRKKIVDLLERAQKKDLFLKIDKFHYTSMIELNKMGLDAAELNLFREIFTNHLNERTYSSLKSYEIDNEIDLVPNLTSFGFEDVFYQELLKVKGIKHFEMDGTVIFYSGSERKTLSDFVQHHIPKKGIGIDDLRSSVFDRYNIRLDTESIKRSLNKGETYYSKDIERIFKNKSAYYDYIYS